MKAKIDRKGNLTIYPETELEGYCLREWSFNYMGGGDRKKVTLEIASGDEYLNKLKETEQ